MIVLALDTSSPATACALVDLRADGPELLAASLHLPPAKAGDLLPDALAALCAQAGVALEQVQGLAASVGPGSFTGLRVGLAAAKGLAYARRWPLAGVSSLEALALAAAAPGAAAGAVAAGPPASALEGAVLVPALEARKGELFCAAFALRAGAGPAAPGALVRVAPDAVVRAEGLAAWLRDLPGAPLVVGPGARQNREALLAAGVPPAALEPEGSAVWPSGLAVAALAAARLRGAAFDAQALFALAPDYLTTSEPEKALAEGRVGKLAPGSGA